MALPVQSRSLAAALFSVAVSCAVPLAVKAASNDSTNPPEGMLALPFAAPQPVVAPIPEPPAEPAPESAPEPEPVPDPGAGLAPVSGPEAEGESLVEGEPAVESAVEPAAGPEAEPEDESGDELPGFFEDAGDARTTAIAEKRGIEMDTESIRSEQSRIIRIQHSGIGEALFSSVNDFTRALDRWHADTYRWLDNAVRALDLRFVVRDSEYRHKLSSFSIRFLGRAGGRGDDGKYDGKVRFRAAISTPGLKRRLNLVVDNAGRDDLPDTDPMKRESDLRIGLQSSWDSHLKLGGGVRMRHVRPVGYVDLEWAWSHPLFGGTFALKPRGVWYSDDGFGQNASVSWTSDRTRHTIWQFVFGETSKESFAGVRLEETVRLAFPHHSKGCGWIFQASVFPHVEERDRTYFDDYLLNVTWRDALYRKWMYYTVTPQLDFADEDDYHPEPSLRIGIEILFGRETGDLI